MEPLRLIAYQNLFYINNPLPFMERDLGATTFFFSSPL